MKNGEYLLSAEKVSTAFRKLAIPALITTLISQIYNLTDTYFIGLLNDSTLLSAVSLAMPVMWLVNSIGGMIGAGAPQVISLHTGSGSRDSAACCRSFCVIGTLVISLIITPIAYMLIDPALRLMNADGAMHTHAAEYLRIIILSSPIIFAGGALSGILRADGYSSQASIAGAAGIIVNIILDPIFIFVFDMGIRGAALATALGSVASLIANLIYTHGMINYRKFLPDIKDIALIFKISLASTCSSVITAFTVGASFSVAVSFGEYTMASISVCSKVYSVVVSIVSTLAFSMQPFIGYNYGAGNHSRLLSGIGISLKYGILVCLAGFAVFMCCGKTLMGLFTADHALIGYGAKCLKYLALGLPVCAVQFGAMSYMSATGKAMRTLIISLARQVLIFVPLMVVLRHFLADIGMMLAYPLTDIIITIPAVAMCIGEIKKMYSQKPTP